MISRGPASTIWERPGAELVTSILPFVEAHVPAAIELWRATEHVGPADEPAAIAAFLRRNPGLSFVAVDEGAPGGGGDDGDGLVATALCGHDGRRGYIYRLAVRPSHRRRGLGSALVDRCLAALVDQGIPKCHAFVFHANPNADLFWAPHGWERRDDLLVYSRGTGGGEG